MLLLGIDLGTSSIKASVWDSNKKNVLAEVHFPEKETEILAPHAGWAEQDPNQWWYNVKQAVLKCNATGNYHPGDIKGIGITYQMHGLVLTDKNLKVIRNSIIWCDSRTVNIGDHAFNALGKEWCLSHLLNSPGTFTATKLAWVKQNEPQLYKKIHKILLPGDFLSMKLTGKCTTTPSAMSEGIFWDFKQNQVSEKVLDYFGFEERLFPKMHPVFYNHGELLAEVARELSLKTNIPVAYKAGDQLNNALSLNVMEPGEVAATAGTSGVIYAVSDKLVFDRESRINSFLHVNHTETKMRIGVLLCINGVGIFNRWIKNLAGKNFSYQELNEMASRIPAGSEGLIAIPFGNGAERVLKYKLAGAHFHNLDLNKHRLPHLVRSVQEGIACAFRYGLDIMKEDGILPATIKVAKTNMFLSDVFTESFVNITGVPLELYKTGGAAGAALGAGIGLGLFDNTNDLPPVNLTERKEPEKNELFEELYGNWKECLKMHVSNHV